MVLGPSGRIHWELPYTGGSLFFKRYASNGIEIKDLNYLYIMTLKKNESLKAYVNRFRDEAAKVEDQDDHSASIPL